MFVALGDEVDHVLVRRRERQVLGQDWLDILRRYELTITLIKETEALSGFFILTRLRSDALVPVVSDHVLHKREIDCVTLDDLRVTFLELLFDVARSHLMEAEVLQDIAEEVVRYGERAFLQVVIEALLEVSGHLGWQVAGS